MVARRVDCSAGSATFTTVPSMNAMLEPMIVAARIQGPFVVAARSHEPARIATSSQGGLAMLAIVHSPPGADGANGFGPMIRVADATRTRNALPIDLGTASRNWYLKEPWPGWMIPNCVVLTPMQFGRNPPPRLPQPR